MFIFFSIYLLAFSFKYKKENAYGFNSTIATAFILIVLAFSILLIDWLLPYPLNAAINIWLGIVAGVQNAYFLIIRYKYKELGNKENVEENTYEDGEIKLKSEYLRKSFHIFVVLVVLCYFLLAVLINDFVYEIYAADTNLYYSIWQSSEYPLTPDFTEESFIVFTWTFFFFIATILLLLIPDIFRIYNRKYSIFSGVYKMVIRMKEFYTVGPQIYLIVGCTFTFLLSVLGYIEPLVAIAAMLIAAIGDAAAAIIGRRYGTHKFNTIFQKTEEKSYEGLIAGGVVSYFCAFFFVDPLIALLGALTFSIMDYLNPKIADNVYNPILCTLAMMIPYWLIP